MATCINACSWFNKFMKEKELSETLKARYHGHTSDPHGGLSIFRQESGSKKTALLMHSAIQETPYPCTFDINIGGETFESGIRGPPPTTISSINYNYLQKCATGSDLGKGTILEKY